MEWQRAGDNSKDRLVAYSLGNFVSNQRKQRTDGGTMIRINAEKKGDRTIITDAAYVLTWVYTPIEKYRKKFYILPAASYENKADFFSTPADYSKMKSFIKDSRKLLNTQNINIPEYMLPEAQLTFNY
jgi:poly-gamma-glutamate synthesis protein (capsule biosynthesis protein)